MVHKRSFFLVLRSFSILFLYTIIGLPRTVAATEIYKSVQPSPVPKRVVDVGTPASTSSNKADRDKKTKAPAAIELHGELNKQQRSLLWQDAFMIFTPIAMATIVMGRLLLSFLTILLCFFQIFRYQPLLSDLLRRGKMKEAEILVKHLETAYTPVNRPLQIWMRGNKEIEKKEQTGGGLSQEKDNRRKRS